MLGYKTELEINVSNLKATTEATQQYIDTIKEERNAIEEKVNSGLAQQEYYNKLVKELESLVDVNGKVKSGYEERVQFILNQLNEAYGTEYKIVDDVIQKYDELKNNIYEVINAEKAKIVLEANEEAYANAIKRTAENQAELRKLTEEKNKTQKSSKGLVDELIGKYGSLKDAENQYLYEHDYIWQDKIRQYKNYKDTMDEIERKINGLADTISTDNKTIIYWEDLKEATITGNTEKIETAMQNLTTAYTTEGENQEKAILDQLNAEISLANDRKKVWEENGIEINDTRRQQLETGIRITADKLVEQTNKVETLGEDEIEAWRKLAEGAENVYNEKISEVDEDTRLIIESVIKGIEDQSGNTYNASYKFGENSAKGIDAGSGDWYKKGRDNATGYINGINSMAWKVGQAAKNMADTALANIAQAQLSHSPSKKTRELGIDNGEGFVLGIKAMIPEAVKSARNLALSTIGSLHNSLSTEGIRINPDDFKIDTNQFVDYGAISGAIQAQSNVEIGSNISQEIKEGVKEAVREVLADAKIKGELDVKANKEGILKIVQIEAEEFEMQTGNPAFGY